MAIGAYLLNESYLLWCGSWLFLVLNHDANW